MKKRDEHKIRKYGKKDRKNVRPLEGCSETLEKGTF